MRANIQPDRMAAGIFQVALAAHQAGRLAEAGKGYRQILDRDRNHVDALHLLGLIHQQEGNPGEAESLIRRALALRPDFADAQFNLGNLFLGTGRPPEAEVAYRRALALRPAFTDAHINLGNLLKQANRLPEADECYRRALEQRPDSADAFNNLGTIFKGTKRWGEAESAYRRALAARPAFADAHHNLGVLLQETGRAAEAEAAYRRALALRPHFIDTHLNLGNLLLQARRLPEAESAYRQALTLKTDSAEVCSNLGNLYREMYRLPEAEAWYRRALVLSPDSASVYNNLGVLFMETQRWHDAELPFRRALAILPDFVEVHQNISMLFHETNRLSEADAAYRRALEIDPDHAEIHMNYGLLLLLRGQLGRGWQEFEFRGKVIPGQPQRQFAQPLWLGDAELDGKSILLYAEWGFGDVLQFMRYAALLRARGATVYLEVLAPLKSLAASCPGVAAAFEWGEPLPPFDFQCPIMSLPLACKTVLETIPAGVPYVASTPSGKVRWGGELGGKTGLRVGLAWAGEPRKHLAAAYAVDRQRSMHFDQMRPLLDVRGVEFFSLQLGDEPAAQLKGNPQVIDFTAELSDFQETAALIDNLDLVICVDTSVAHLAGALAKPVWLLNRYNTCWRWMQDREDSPWYPTMRIFRQASLGDWDSVIGNVKLALEELVLSSRRPI